ncbi:MAG: Trk family potassium uptake protein [Chloroflexi bacterium]|nr:Trk family potassium uptake protein [Chloroflexota bacterium]
MAQQWRRRLGDRVVRRPRLREISPVRLGPQRERPGAIPASKYLLFWLVAGFLALILMGAGLLLLPVASTGEGPAPFLTALFTATSAVTVTGLVVVSTGTYWTVFGQAVILVLIFIGGLGFMSAGTLLFIIIGRRATLGQLLLLRESLGEMHMGRLVSLVWRIVLVAMGIQVLGFALLLFHFSGMFDGAKATWQALFHAVSGFNNAGFDLMPGTSSLSDFRQDYTVLAIMGALIVLGGISFTVMVDLVRERRFRRLTLDTQLVLVTSLVLWLVGAVVAFAFEYRNSSTLGGLPVAGQVANSFFHSITARTAGFSTFDVGSAQQQTNVFYTVLMFIGGASGSAAGGIKVNTLAVIAVAVFATLRGRGRAEVFRREVPDVQVFRAMSVVALALSSIFVVALLLTITEQTVMSGGVGFIDLLFETFSAFATVGLSTGITSKLTPGGQWLIMLTMFVGRLGPLTLALGLAMREKRPVYRYAQERVKIG